MNHNRIIIALISLLLVFQLTASPAKYLIGIDSVTGDEYEISQIEIDADDNASLTLDLIFSADWIYKIGKALLIYANQLEDSLANNVTIEELFQATANYQTSDEIATQIEAYGYYDDITDIPAGITRDSEWNTLAEIETVVSENIITSAEMAAAGYGDVSGPASSADNAIARFDGTTGKIIQNACGIYATDTGSLGVGVAAPSNAIEVANLIKFDDTNYNTLIGKDAFNNSEQSYNTALGYQAGYNNNNTAGNEGKYNTYVGHGAGKGSGSGNKNTGYHNSAIGYVSLYTNTTGYYNSAIGNYSLYANTTGYHNSAIGYASLYANTTGYRNSAIGYASLYANTTGYYNSAIGNYSLFSLRPTSKAITAFTDNGDSKTQVTSAGHGQVNTTVVQISGTTSYNGSWTIEQVATDTFVINKVFVANDATGWWGIDSESRRNIGIGAYSAYMQTTASNQLFIDNLLRANAAEERTNSIIYGVMAGLPADQDLYFNADVFLKADDRRLYFGGGNDAYMKYDGMDLIINSAAVGTGDVKINSGVTINDSGDLILKTYTDATRPAAGTAGRLIFNSDDGHMNSDNGTNWLDMAGASSEWTDQGTYLEPADADESVRTKSDFQVVDAATKIYKNGSDMQFVDANTAAVSFASLAAASRIYDLGDLAAIDYTQATLTVDGAWHTLDLSSKIPSSAREVCLWIYIANDAVGYAFQVREDGNSNAINVASIRNQVAGVGIDGNFWVTCSSSQKIEYAISAGMDTAWLTVRKYSN